VGDSDGGGCFGVPFLDRIVELAAGTRFASYQKQHYHPVE